MDMESFMEQARVLQDRVSAAQDLLDKTTVRGIADAGACIVTMTGKYDLVDIKVSDALAGRDAAAISETVLAAFRDAKAKADAARRVCQCRNNDTNHIKNTGNPRCFLCGLFVLLQSAIYFTPTLVNIFEHPHPH